VAPGGRATVRARVTTRVPAGRSGSLTSAAVALALVSVIAVAALAAALLLLRSRNGLRRQLTSAQAETGRVADGLAAATRERDELHD
jgi:hypothetical protein